MENQGLHLVVSILEEKFLNAADVFNLSQVSHAFRRAVNEQTRWFGAGVPTVRVETGQCHIGRYTIPYSRNKSSLDDYYLSATAANLLIWLCHRGRFRMRRLLVLHGHGCHSVTFSRAVLSVLQIVHRSAFDHLEDIHIDLAHKPGFLCGGLRAATVPALIALFARHGAACVQLQLHLLTVYDDELRSLEEAVNRCKAVTKWAVQYPTRTVL